MGFLEGLSLVLLYMKLGEKHPDVSWTMVFAPVLLSSLITLAFFIVATGYVG